jgi:hypothetical protein
MTTAFRAVAENGLNKGHGRLSLAAPFDTVKYIGVSDLPGGQRAPEHRNRGFLAYDVGKRHGLLSFGKPGENGCCYRSLHIHNVLISVYDNKPVRFRRSQLQIACSDPLVKLDGFLFNNSSCPFIASIRQLPSQADFHRTVKEYGQMRAKLADCQPVKLPDQGKIQLPAVTLVSYGGVGEAITDYYVACFEGRRNNFGDMLRPGSGIQEQFGQGHHTAVRCIEQNLTDFI